MRIAKLSFLFSPIVFCAVVAWATAGPGLKGRVVDPSGAAIPGARVTVTNIGTGATVRSTTDGKGDFAFTGLAPLLYQITVEKSGFQTDVRQVNLESGEPSALTITLAVQTMVQSVEVHASAPGATLQPSQQQLLKLNQTVRVLSRLQMDSAGPLAGAGQIAAQAPGANVVSYSNTGGSKSTIVLNGVNQGWGGYGGYNYPGSLDVTLDGMPLPDAATGLWASASLPQTKMFQNVNVTYGPGNPVERYYTDVGGAFNFVPMEPSSKMHIDGTLSFGSYSQKNIELNMSTGEFRGWSTVVSGGMGKGDSFRRASDGFRSPDKDGAIFVKTTKSFESGAFSVGGYYARSGSYRAQVIPMTDVPTLTIEGIGANAVDYSQVTSGFYSTLPYDAYNKYDVNELGLIYAKETFLLDNSTAFENDTWYTHEFRMHQRNNDAYIVGTQLQEFNDPHHNTVGDRFVLTKTLPLNKIAVGGYLLHDLYNTRNNFFNVADGGAGQGHIVNIGGKFRSSYFDQDNYVAFVQDDFRPVRQVHITPGVRFDLFHTGYYSGALQDFTFAPGVVLRQHCPDPASDNSSDPTVNTNNQSADCGMNATEKAIEPSINASFEPTDWLTLYGGYTKTYRSPSLGGGGGLFQSLDPRTNYILASGTYYQAGFKFHKSLFGPTRNVLFGAAYFHLRYANEQLGVELGNGNFINTSGSSNYHGVNAYIDLDPVRNLHLYTNLTGEGATYDQFYSGSESFQGLPVSYVPAETWNTGAYYSYPIHEKFSIEPRIWFQYMGSQHIFDNCGLQGSVCTTALPSQRTMPSYETVNLSLRVPYKYLSFDVDMLNLFNNQYNIYEYVSAGGYFSNPNGGPSPSGGYTFAYPGAPFTAYASVGFHF